MQRHLGLFDKNVDINKESSGLSDTYSAQGELAIIRKSLSKTITLWLKDSSNYHAKLFLLNRVLDEASNASFASTTEFAALPSYLRKVWLKPEDFIPDLDKKITANAVKTIIQEEVSQILRAEESSRPVAASSTSQVRKNLR